MFISESSFAVFPVCGMVMAGWPSPAEEELEDTLTFEEWLVPRKESSWLVHVSTDALRGCGIINGDIAVLERGRNPKYGDIIIARTDEKTVIRRYEKQNNHPVLVSANPSFPSIPFSELVQVLGVVSAIIRKYK